MSSIARASSDQCLIEKLIFLLEEQTETLTSMRAHIAEETMANDDPHDILDSVSLMLKEAYVKLSVHLNKLD